MISIRIGGRVSAVIIERRVVVFVLAIVACSKGGEPPPGPGNTASTTSSCKAGNEQACEEACDRGDNPSCDQLTLIYLQTKRRAEASALSRRLCDAGRKFFCPTYAFALAEGDGVRQDRALARKLFEQSCEHDPNGCSEFGNLYMSGTGVQQDLEVGSFLLELACRHRDQQACRELAAFKAATK